jgi:hypothetical protein
LIDSYCTPRSLWRTGPAGARHSQADDLPRKHFDDERLEDEFGVGRDVGQIRHPQLVWSRGGEVALYQIHSVSSNPGWCTATTAVNLDSLRRLR